MTHYDTIRSFAKMLRNLNQWLEKAEAHAKAKSFDVDILAHARLAPETHSLAEQIQAACDTAKFAAMYLSGKLALASAQPDIRQKISDIRQAIEKNVALLEKVGERDLEGSQDRRVKPGWLTGHRWFRGDDYVIHVAIPNFFFHVTMVYAILRHNGVDLGTMDYVGQLPLQG
jgi:uncharacterized protein